ncbi:hypothetical protein BDA96_05G115400 [Sorghum bicolor]|uniref:Uncharacterized protein n=1 Tax=Sorghum bicolor TaxID=4558 RepID=A0A921QXZ0_SORBI|nr:hypothetical protein BDA96_05G115400 [Sorghum bicolor]
MNCLVHWKWHPLHNYAMALLLGQLCWHQLGSVTAILGVFFISRHLQ